MVGAKFLMLKSVLAGVGVVVHGGGGPPADDVDDDVEPEDDVVVPPEDVVPPDDEDDVVPPGGGVPGATHWLVARSQDFGAVHGQRHWLAPSESETSRTSQRSGTQRSGMPDSSLCVHVRSPAIPPADD